jgi:hypothetical protein
MYDDQQRRIEALRRLAQEQLRAQQAQQSTQQSAVDTPAPERADDAELVVEPLTSRASGAQGRETASTRMSRGSRRGLAWILIGALALLALAGSFGLRRFVPAPTPTATPITGNELIVTSNFNSGSVSLNGKKVDGALPVLLRLKPGENTITYSAPPFRDRTCRVTLLPQQNVGIGQRVQTTSDGCGMFGYDQQPPLSLSGVTVRNGALTLPLTGADLPDAARNSAESALTAKLGNLSRLPVPAGDYYATGVTTSGRIISARAAMPLVATPALSPLDAASGAAGACLHLSCAGAELLPDARGVTAPAGVWLVRQSFTMNWRFTTQSGALVAISPSRTPLETLVGLTYSPTAGWSVTEGSPGTFLVDVQSQILSASCQGGFAALSALVAKSSLAGQQTNTSQGGQNGPGAASQPTDGCALKLETSNNNIFNPVMKEYGHYVWRWGVLLAADAQARAQFPSLPSAPQSEITAVGGIGF